MVLSRHFDFFSLGSPLLLVEKYTPSGDWGGGDKIPLHSKSDKYVQYNGCAHQVLARRCINGFLFVLCVGVKFFTTLGNIPSKVLSFVLRLAGEKTTPNLGTDKNENKLNGTHRRIIPPEHRCLKIRLKHSHEIVLLWRESFDALESINNFN